jgi:hypothetical protein
LRVESTINRLTDLIALISSSPCAFSLSTNNSQRRRQQQQQQQQQTVNSQPASQPAWLTDGAFEPPNIVNVWRRNIFL